MSARFGNLTFAVPIALFLSGCATGPPALSDISNAKTEARVQLSPQIALLNVPVREARAVIDSDGHVHVLAISRSRDLYYLAIGPEGVTNPVIIRAEVTPHYWSPVNFGAAFDHVGHLHVLVNQNHLLLEDGLWRDAQPAPPCGQLLTVGQDLVCAFLTKGDEIGSPGRWDWFAFYGLVLPWHFRSTKLVIARLTPDGSSGWTVIDPDGNRDVKAFSLATDNQGTVHIFYIHGRFFLLAEDVQPAYAHLDSRAGHLSLETGTNPSQQDRDQIVMATNTGKAITGMSDLCPNRHLSTALAVDPESGTSMIVACVIELSFPDFGKLVWKSVTIRAGTEDPPTSLQLHEQDFPIVRRFSDPHLAPAGRNQFHAVMTWDVDTLYYLCFADGTWSTPTVLGSIGGGDEAIQLVSDHRGRALAIWPSTNGSLVARWIELMQ